MKFYIIWGLIPECTHDTAAVAFPTKHVLYADLRRFLMMSCRTKTETVSRMEKAWPFDRCCSHQSVASPSLCWLNVCLIDCISGNFSDSWNGFLPAICSSWCSSSIFRALEYLAFCFQFNNYLQLLLIQTGLNFYSEDNHWSCRRQAV